jgi:hypothetical protein
MSSSFKAAFTAAGINTSTFTKPAAPAVCRVVYAPPLPVKQKTRPAFNPKFGKKPKMFHGISRQMEKQQHSRLVPSAKLGGEVKVWGLRMQGGYEVGKFDR